MANFGIHWHGPEGREPSPYADDVKHLLELMRGYAEMTDLPLREGTAAPLLHYRETPPQHFESRNGGGSYDARIMRGPTARAVCAPLRASTTNVGPQSLNRIALAAVRALPGRSVRWLPAFEALSSRSDAHTVERHDCTHWCYSPLLWDPVLAPFYEEVVEQFGGGTISHAIS